MINGLNHQIYLQKCPQIIPTSFKNILVVYNPQNDALATPSIHVGKFQDFV